MHVTGFNLEVVVPLSSRTEGKSKWLLGPSQYIHSLKEQFETLCHLTVFGRDELIFEELFQNVNVIQNVDFSHKNLAG